MNQESLITSAQVLNRNTRVTHLCLDKTQAYSPSQFRNEGKSGPYVNQSKQEGLKSRP